MSIEDAVRVRHSFEDRLRNFLTLASFMDDRELEIALARLADMVLHAPDSAAIRLRGEALKQYWDLRTSGLAPYSQWKRAFASPPPGMVHFDARIDRSPSDRFVRSISNFVLLVDGQIAPPPSVTPTSFSETSKLLARP